MCLCVYALIPLDCDVDSEDTLKAVRSFVQGRAAEILRGNVGKYWAYLIVVVIKS